MGPAVLEMIEALTAAVHSGRIEDLRSALDLNDLAPDVGGASGGDVIAHLKAASPDGKGYGALAALGLLLDTRPVLLPLGRDLENNRVWVWPGFAETALSQLEPAQEVELRKLVPAAALEGMVKSGRYSGPRLIIGQDGIWHRFALP